jgi:hypothetical protein
VKADVNDPATPNAVIPDLVKFLNVNLLIKLGIGKNKGVEEVVLNVPVVICVSAISLPH